MLKAVVNSPIRSGDQTINDGNLVIGTAGKGVDFSASAHAAGMTSELLDDYEEGAFTPTWGAEGGNPTIVYYTNAGRYTKIGNVVFFGVKIAVQTVSGGSGTLRLYGLPFLCAADVVDYSVSKAFVFNWNTNPKTYVVQAGTDSVLIYADDATNTLAVAGDLKNDSYFFASGFYRTAT